MSKIFWKALTISPETIGSKEMLSEWRWLSPNKINPIWLNTFGDLALETDDWKIFFLDRLEGTFFPLVPSKQSFDEIFNDEQSRSRWLMADWFQICNERGLSLGLGQCYGWKLAPALGGKFEFENIQVFDLTVYQSIMGQIHRQIQKRLEGFTISEFKTGNTPLHQPCFNENHFNHCVLPSPHRQCSIGGERFVLKGFWGKSCGALNHAKPFRSESRVGSCLHISAGCKR